MPNIKSAKKRVLVSEARNARNKANRSALKTAIKKFEAAAVEGNRTEAEGAYKVAVKSIDKAAAKGLLHKNNAAHKKSALTLKLNNIVFDISIVVLVDAVEASNESAVCCVMPRQYAWDRDVRTCNSSEQGFIAKRP